MKLQGKYILCKTSIGFVVHVLKVKEISAGRTSPRNPSSTDTKREKKREKRKKGA